jgi:hypothetical protein
MAAFGREDVFDFGNPEDVEEYEIESANKENPGETAQPRRIGLPCG